MPEQTSMEEIERFTAEAYSIACEQNDAVLVAAAADSYASMYVHVDRPEEALRLLRPALAGLGEDPPAMLRFWMQLTIANALYRTGDICGARRESDLAAGIADRLQFEWGRLWCAAQRAELLRADGDPHGCLAALDWAREQARRMAHPAHEPWHQSIEADARLDLHDVAGSVTVLTKLNRAAPFRAAVRVGVLAACVGRVDDGAEILAHFEADDPGWHRNRSTPRTTAHLEWLRGLVGSSATWSGRDDLGTHVAGVLGAIGADAQLVRVPPGVPALQVHVRQAVSA